MAFKEWTTNYPGAQDTDPVGSNEQPTLSNNPVSVANPPGTGDNTRVSQIHTLRDKLHSVCKKVGDNSNLPAGCYGERITTLEARDSQIWSYIPQTDPTGFGGTRLCHYDLDGTGNELNDRVGGYNLTVGSGSTCRQKVRGIIGHQFFSDYYLVANGTDDTLRVCGNLTVQLLLCVGNVSANDYILTCGASGETLKTNDVYCVAFGSSLPKLYYFAEYGTGTNIGYTSYAAASNNLLTPVLITMTRSSNDVTFYIDDYAVSSSSGLHIPEKDASGNTQKLYIGCTSGLGSLFDGIIFSARVCSGAFSSAMVTEVYNAVAPP